MRGRWLLPLGTLVVATGAILLFTTEPAMAGRYEEPTYSVQEQGAGFEIRRYDGWIEARVTLTGAMSSAVREGFGVLAGYIFGGNRARTSIDMTTPVTAQAPSQRIDMTTPVAATADEQGWTVSFMMPSQWTLQTLPVPDDARVQLVEVPGSLQAVRTFSGRANDTLVAGELEALRQAVQASGYAIVGPHSVAQFNPPWILGPWRRNEVRLPVAAAGASPTSD